MLTAATIPSTSTAAGAITPTTRPTLAGLLCVAIPMRTIIDATVRLVSFMRDAPLRYHPEMTGEMARAPKGRAPHRRDENARLAVLHAADDLLVERGFNGVTIEGIAARAGVAKQTIYRWWPSKVEILLDTLIEDAERQLAISETGSVLEATRRYLRKLATFLTRDPAGRVLLALIGEAQHDAKTAVVFAQRYLEPQRRREREML